MYAKRLLLIVLLVNFLGIATAQDHSIARAWNEIVLEGIRNDFARPTIHARNLFHTSVAMYDAWALFDETATPYLIGQQMTSFQSDFDPSILPSLKTNKDIEKTISHAMYSLLSHRYAKSPDFEETKELMDALMAEKGYDIHFTSFDYTDKNPASLGNFIALEIIKYGLQDGANEQNDYQNDFYKSVNQPLDPTLSGVGDGINPNRWQPLLFNTFIDQSGNPLPESVPNFLSPEWGFTMPFALGTSDRKIMKRDSQIYHVYLDPGAPPDIENERAAYQWGFALVAAWSADLEHEDTTVLDISPASLGNILTFPTTLAEYQSFYQATGGDWGKGHPFNPITNQPYAPNLVPKGDYTRVLAEFWADGPDSETPPGHWFSILNYVMDHPAFTRKYAGIKKLSPLEYELKAYFMLGGAVHDAAIAAWSVKGYYDYIRPISALRYMAKKGQSSEPQLSNYHPEGIPLIPNVIELIEEGDADFPDTALVGKLKFRGWKGPNYIDNPEIEAAGVDWILAANWWPYQRPSFITPPFAGYVSGHSTFSRAAAEILTYVTGDAYFPGGMGTFLAPKNDFLVFEEGPSEDVLLQWATYLDASDQCSLSRIWGGIHPPADDIPGRKMGIIVANKTIHLANKYFNGTVELDEANDKNKTLLFPNPLSIGDKVNLEIDGVFKDLSITNAQGQILYQQGITNPNISLPTHQLQAGVYFIVLNNNGYRIAQKLMLRE